MIDLITGHQGVAHISAEQVATVNDVMMYGYGQDAVIRLKNGTVSADGLSVTVNTGYWRLNGYDMQIVESEEVTLAPAGTGLGRIDVIYAEILQDKPSGVQRSELVVVSGTESANPQEPDAPEDPQLTTDLLLLAIPVAKCTISESTMSVEDLTLPLEENVDTNQVRDIVNVLNSKNLIPFPYYDKTVTDSTIYIYMNSWGRMNYGKVTAEGSADTQDYVFHLTETSQTGAYPGESGGLFIPTNVPLKLTGCPEGGKVGNTPKYSIRLKIKDGANFVTYEDFGDGVIIYPLTGAESYTIYSLDIVIYQGTYISEGIVFEPMLRPLSIKNDKWVQNAETNYTLTYKSKKNLNASCSTIASEQYKEVYTDAREFLPRIGTRIWVHFTNKNTAANPRMMIDGTSDYPIVSFGNNKPSVWWDDDEYVEFVYYNSKYYMMPTQAQIDALQDRTDSISLYGTSDTAASTTAKVATTLDGNFVLSAGNKVFIKFDYENTATAPTLNVDSTGAVTIKGYGTTAPDIWWKTGDIVEFIYDGTNWIMQPTQGQIAELNNDLSDWQDITSSDNVDYGNIVATSGRNIHLEINPHLKLGHLYGSFATNAALAAFQTSPLIYVNAQYLNINGGATIFNANQSRAHNVCIYGGTYLCTIQWADATAISGPVNMSIDLLFKLP